MFGSFKSDQPKEQIQTLYLQY